MATTQDSEAGWEIFKENDFAASLAQINDRLTKLGFSPVSPRTYRHYQKLRRYGYEFYVPINQLDVRTVRDPVWDKAVRGRYLARPIFTPVVLRLIVSEALVQLEGTAVQISDGEVVVKFRGSKTVDFFKALPSTDRAGELVFADDGEVTSVQVERVSLDVGHSETTLRLTFTSVTDLSRFLPATVLPVVALTVIVGADDEKFLATEVQRFYWIFQGIESSRIVCQEIAAELDPGRQFALPVPRLLRLSSQSPLSATVEVAEAVAIIFLAIYGAYGHAAKAYWESRVQKETARRLRWENDLDGVPKRFDTKKIVAAVSALLRRQMAEAGLESPNDIPEEVDRAAAIIERDIVPAARDLAESSRGEVEITTDRPIQKLDPLRELPPKRPPRRKQLPPSTTQASPKAVRSAPRALPPSS